MSEHQQHSHHKHQHGHQHHGGQEPAQKKKIHHDWRFWVSIVAVGLMLLSMVIYVVTNDESLQPAGGNEPQTPAAEK